MQPIETAPKDKRILLVYETPFFTDHGTCFVCGKWDDDQYAARPRPYWTNDYDTLLGKRIVRGKQPIGWMPLPTV
jgi:hypothetical protein